MKKPIIAALVAIVAIVFFLVLSGGLYTVHETEQVIVTQFGDAVGEPVTEPGLKFKIPLIQKANFFDKRILEWDGQATEMPTKDKTYIEVDTYGRWKIVEPLQYFEKLRDERSAKSRLDDIIGSETRNTIAEHELIEVIRTTKEREPQVEDEIQEADLTGSVGKLIPIKRGRSALEGDILETAKAKLDEFGIELLDVRFKRINYNQSVQEQIYERMISERQQIAEKFRSEGEGEAAKILGDMERELRTIESEAYKKVETIRGEADAEATEIYAEAYDRSLDAAEFYEFLRTMELYEGMLVGESTVVLSTDSDLFKYLKAVKPVGPSKSANPLVPRDAAGGGGDVPGVSGMSGGRDDDADGGAQEGSEGEEKADSGPDANAGSGNGSAKKSGSAGSEDGEKQAGARGDGAKKKEAAAESAKKKEAAAEGAKEKEAAADGDGGPQADAGSEAEEKKAAPGDESESGGGGEAPSEAASGDRAGSD